MMIVRHGLRSGFDLGLLARLAIFARSALRRVLCLLVIVLGLGLKLVDRDISLGLVPALWLFIRLRCQCMELRRAVGWALRLNDGLCMDGRIN